MSFAAMNSRLSSIRLVVAWGLLLAASASARGQQEFELNEETFQQWLRGNRQVQPEPESEIAAAVEAVDLTCGLSDAQKLKLRLAAQGDFARFEEQVDALRSEIVGKTYDQNEFGNVYQRVQKLTVAYQAGLLGPASLFSKVLARTLDDTQREQYEQGRAARQQAHHAAKVRLAVAMLERICPLTSAQRTALVDLWLANTRPPKRRSEYDWYVVMVQAHRIPDEQYREFLDDAQLQAVRRWLQQAAALEQFLRGQGVLPES